MKDKYKSFSQLKNSCPKSYKIEYDVRNTSFLIFTPHGGGIEPGTTEICKWFNNNSYSYYSFTGIGTNCKELHITSTLFDEPKLGKILSKHKYAISFHGMTDNMKQKYEADIFLGGLDIALINSLEEKLTTQSFAVKTFKDYQTSLLAAMDPNNVTNKCGSKQGVQIELSESIRESFFKGNYRLKKGRSETTAIFEKFCSIIKEIIEIRVKKNGL
ncbi:MAG: poly-gamma-glutamate hydrolase family protein [Bacteroidales bacterium]|nr:poly-gamma-glutamate hydrolase family protein [Bacteroidales bacterium]